MLLVPGQASQILSLSPAISTLYDIENLMKRRRKIRGLSFLKLRHTNITEEVGKLSTQLEDAIKLFTVSARLVRVLRLADPLTKLRSLGANWRQY